MAYHVKGHIMHLNTQIAPYHPVLPFKILVTASDSSL